ncbi:M20 family metallopeptidase [Salinicoccus roseus]|uniref:M20 family metallopeptidase n=1 Tax=Salinicoccus roseus TaxID=45670 RepID=UPI00230014C9|nr:M20 family metallopeptidase [Salinicoccus roseus]
MNNFKKYLTDNDEDIFNHIEEIVKMETPSDNKELLDKAALWIAEKFEDLTGGSAEIIDNKETGNHVIGTFGQGEKQLLLLAHFDTVWESGTLNHMPFRKDSNKAYGPGIFDMKTGLIQTLYALKSIRELGEKLNKRIVCIFDSDEEIGNPTSKNLIEKEAKISERAFVMEPAMSEKGSLKTSRKGVGIYRMTVKGKPAHSGIDPEKGISAIEELARQTVYLHSLSNMERGITVNVGVFNGGSRSNVIAEEAMAEIDVRAKTVSDLKMITEEIENITPFHDGTEIEISGDINRMPLERTEGVIEMYQKALKISVELGIDLSEAETGGGSDGNLTSVYVPTLDGLGAVGDGAHANHEHINLNHVVDRTALLANLLKEYGN